MTRTDNKDAHSIDTASMKLHRAYLIVFNCNGEAFRPICKAKCTNAKIACTGVGQSPGSLLCIQIDSRLALIGDLVLLVLQMTLP